MVWTPDVLHVDGPFGTIPATLFVSREARAGAPVILLGHGAHTSKDDPTMQVLARALARGVDAGVVTLDCPGHGERRPADLDESAFDSLVQANMTDPDVFEQLATEWPLVAAAARGRDLRLSGATALRRILDGERLRFRDRAPARGRPRRCVLAVGGLLDEQAADPVAAERNAARNRIIRHGAAAFGDRQVLMTNMTHDEHFPIAGALEVFGLLPGPKRMGVWEGTHEQLDAEAMTMAVDFFRSHFRGPARHTMSGTHETTELLDVDMDQLARMAPHITVRWLRRPNREMRFSPKRASTTPTVETAIRNWAAI